MKATLALALATVVLAAITYGLAFLCVEINAAGALLSPAGVDDPSVLLAAGGFALARLASALCTVLTLALGAAQLTLWVWSKARP